ncbi:MAG: helix-hairpin-helix domain-containing protein [Ornithinimicrobium sp.]
MPPRSDRAQDLIDSLRQAGASSAPGSAPGEGDDRAKPPPRLFTLPAGLRGARLWVKPSAVRGAALVVLVVLIVLGVRVAWAERTTQPELVAPADVTAATAAPGTEQGSPAASAQSAVRPGGAVPGSSGTAAPEVSSVVHVIGAVSEPGVVTVAPGARVGDVVEAAGGATDQAELSRVNLARVVSDGERIWVPLIGADPPPDLAAPPAATEPAGMGEGASAASDHVDINAADESRLQDLPGIGPVTAAAMIEWRDQHGSFTTVEELLEVSGIGPRTLENLRPMVQVGP